MFGGTLLGLNTMQILNAQVSAFRKRGVVQHLLHQLQDDAARLLGKTDPWHPFRPQSIDYLEDEIKEWWRIVAATKEKDWRLIFRLYISNCEKY